MHYKLPRCYLDQPLKDGATLDLGENHAHYLHTVLRRKDGHEVRVFNGVDGEWLARLAHLKKKGGQLVLVRQIRAQPPTPARLALFFAPITKTRMDWMIEKAVELGVTDLHPVLTQNTEVRTLKPDKVLRQCIEAAEQAERLTIPSLHPVKDVFAVVEHAGMPILACIERFDAAPLHAFVPALEENIGILIGPAGGFTEEEKYRLAAIKTIIPVSLGENVLRCETAALFALSGVITTRAKAGTV